MIIFKLVLLNLNNIGVCQRSPITPVDFEYEVFLFYKIKSHMETKERATCLSSTPAQWTKKIKERKIN